MMGFTHPTLAVEGRRVGMQFVTRRVTKDTHLSVMHPIAESPQRGQGSVTTQRVGTSKKFIFLFNVNFFAVFSLIAYCENIISFVH